MERAEILRRLTPTERLALQKSLETLSEPLGDFIVRATPRFDRPQHLAPLMRLLERARWGERVRALVFAPPRHAKSQTLLHAIPWWLLARPRDTVGYITYGAQFAAGQSDIARTIAASVAFPFSPSFNTREEWRSAHGGGCVATGIDGAVLGKGFNLLIVDDPHKNRVEAESPRMRAQVQDLFKGTLLQRMEPNGSIIVTHQRWVDDDLIGALQREGGWDSYSLPARDPVTDVLLWPGRYSRDELDSLRHKNEYNWWSQYMGSPRPRGGAVFKREPYRFEGSGKIGRWLMISVDAAGTESTRSDYTVALCLAFDGTGDEMTCNVIDMVRVQLEPQDAAKVLRDFRRKHGDPFTVIEGSRDGKAQAKALELLGLTGVETVPPIGDKFIRAQPVASAQNDPRGPRVGVPADAETRPWVADFLAEQRLFTGTGNKHDDIVDALSLGWNCAAEPVTESAPAQSVSVSMPDCGF